MTLSALIRKRNTGNLATAIPAISATQLKGEAATVARIATVAVANHKEEKTVLSAKVGAGDTATASRWWCIYYLEKEPEVITYFPDATYKDIFQRHPDAISAAPFTLLVKKPRLSLTVDEEKSIRNWLARIDETDPLLVANVIERCQQDADDRAYFLKQAKD